MPARAQTIVVGYSGSEASLRALETAAALIGYGSRLTVVTVPSANVDGKAVDTARDLLLSRHVAARYLEPLGDPVEKLVESASDVGADLIVVGRDRSGGSVSADVVRAASCNVLVVP